MPSFESQPSGWTDLFSVDVIGTDVVNTAGGFATRLTDISGLVHGSGDNDGILAEIATATNDIPMVIRNDDDDEDVVGIVSDISGVNTLLQTLKGEVDTEIGTVLNKINVIADPAGQTDPAAPDMYGFGDKLEKYKKYKRSSDTAVEKYNQQMNNHIVSLTTNIAIFAGAMGIVYMSAKSN